MMVQRRQHSARGEGRGLPAASLRELRAAARRAAGTGHAPYSRFAVGAALLDDRETIFTGANVENAAYPLGVCAERCALLAWRVAGGGRIRLVVIHTETPRPTSPCGLCREALLRWAPAAEIYLSSRRGLAGPYPAGSWLPGGNAGQGRP